ncbi:putative glutamine amidotransferase [Rodentibacter pneumotropicus]|uniref:Putative glutamine amidotransferase n=1 Tax=Rodentibacter pneumotropicus TaxID=758 RepID=A0A3S4W029_9PAST|nr:putative glutamine amidotransferase [Rodentibacter pneumotropicus]
MCQLLGMNCNTPTDIVFSFEGFRRRAGLTGRHSDGFGIAFLKDGEYGFSEIIALPPILLSPIV